MELKFSIMSRTFIIYSANRLCVSQISQIPTYNNFDVANFSSAIRIYQAVAHKFVFHLKLNMFVELRGKKFLLFEHACIISI